MDAIDAKGNFILGTATGVASATLVLQTLLLSLHLQSNCSMLPAFLAGLPLLLKQIIPFLLVQLAYLIVIIIVIVAYRTRDFYQVPDPNMLLENLDKPEQENKDGMVRAMVAAYEMNENETRKKVRWIDLSLLFLVIEIGALILNLLYQVSC